MFLLEALVKDQLEFIFDQRVVGESWTLFCEIRWRAYYWIDAYSS